MNANGVVVLPEQASIWNMDPERIATFRLMSQQTGDSVSVFEESIPKGVETALHLHHGSDEAMCVLSGQFAFKIGGTTTHGGVGTWAFMPKEVAHAWKNVTEGTGRALFMFTPAVAGKLFEDLRRRQLPFLTADPAVLSPLLRQYGWEILGPPPVYDTSEK
jgi:quercetin dioxygenase-like cupin family protein